MQINPNPQTKMAALTRTLNLDEVLTLRADFIDFLPRDPYPNPKKARVPGIALYSFLYFLTRWNDSYIERGGLMAPTWDIPLP